MSITNNRIGGSITGATGVSINNVINTNNSITSPTASITGFNLPTIQPGTASGYLLITNGTDTLSWTQSGAGGAGTSGSSGISGTSGSSGISGTSGSSGISGTSGSSGISGTSGSSGISGTSGSSGISGTSGSSGISGTSGSSGITGATGSNGSSGTSGAGGSGSSDYLQYPVLGQLVGSGPWGKPFIDLLGYNTQNTTTVVNRIYLQPFKEQTGSIINTLGFSVNTGVAGHTMSFAIYNVATQSITNSGRTEITTVPGTFSVIGTISVATSGDKIITGINYTLPTTLNNTYYIGFMSTTASSVKTWTSVVSIFPKWNTGIIAGSVYYRAFNAMYTAPSFAFIDNINGASYSQNTGGDLLAAVYTTK